MARAAAYFAGLLDRLFARGYTRANNPQELMRAARQSAYPREKMQVPKRQTRFCYSDGPMYYLGQQIVKQMQDAGYPAKILYCYRSHQQQADLYAKGRTAPGPKVTNARPGESPHQYFEAVDIIHPSKGWEVSEQYWSTLASCVRIVANKYNVRLKHGHDWDGDGIPVHLDPDETFRDSAHIELADWRVFRDRVRSEILDDAHIGRPNGVQLWQRFCEVLPEVAKARA